MSRLALIALIVACQPRQTTPELAAPDLQPDRWTARPATTQDPSELLWDTLEGPLGGGEPVALALAWRDGGPLVELRTTIEGETSTTALPWALEELAALVIADLDKDDGDELLILGDWITGMGPGGVVPFGAAVVLDRRGNEIVAEPAEKLDEARTAAEVTAALGIPAKAAPGRAYSSVVSP